MYATPTFITEMLRLVTQAQLLLMTVTVYINGLYSTGLLLLGQF